jgi:hypothetical protein
MPCMTDSTSFMSMYEGGSSNYLLLYLTRGVLLEYNLGSLMTDDDLNPVGCSSTGDRMLIEYGFAWEAARLMEV